MGAIKIVSASAGSGKTYRLTTELVEGIRSRNVRPDAVVAMTFTRKAAAELQERVRARLVSDEKDDLLNQKEPKTERTAKAERYRSAGIAA